MQLKDAVKTPCSTRGQALLQWDFDSSIFPRHSVQMPEKDIDAILMWRDFWLPIGTTVDRLNRRLGELEDKCNEIQY